ncbi:MAG: GNAT family N-acetyltransferase [bacterium]
MNWIPPQIKEYKFILGNKNPLWNHAERMLFLLRKKEKIVGRIAGIIDYNHISFHNEKCGFFGFFECSRDYAFAKRLLDEVCDWLREKDIEIIRGPVNPSMNDECGFLVEGFDSPPFLMMPYNPRYYIDYIEKYGLEKCKDLYAYLFEITPAQIGNMEKISKRVEKQRARVRPINLKNFAQEINIIKEIYNTSWRDNWGFVPMTDEEIMYMAKRLKSLLVPELLLILEVKGNFAGFVMTLPNYNEALRNLNKHWWDTIKLLWRLRKIKSLRVIAMGVKPEYRRRGFEALLYLESLKIALKKGYQQCEFSWILEDNILTQRAAEKMGGKLYKRYRIYEMKI